MIFVTVGSDEFQFNRLVKAVDEYCGQERRPAHIQLGSSDYRPHYCQWSKFLSFDEMQSLVKKSSVIIAHAGAGTILTCINNGKIPFVVPRLSDFGEAVDDHQVEFAYRMQKHGYAHVIGLENLADALINFNAHNFASFTSQKVELIDYLNQITKLAQQPFR